MGSKPDSSVVSFPETVAPRVGLALQGGGNHGAFTWGVLRALLPELEKRNIPISGIIGASAGALNAVYAGHGMLVGEPGKRAETADLMMERLWFSSAVLAVPVRMALSAKNLSDPGKALAEMFQLTDNMTRGVASNMLAMGNLFNAFGSRAQDSKQTLVAAYAKIPAIEFAQLIDRHGLPVVPGLQDHPLQHLVDRHIDFDALGTSTSPKIIVGTTNLRTGALNVHMGEACTSQAVASSGTLPELFNALHIGDSEQWDGGFSANPPIMPMYQKCPDMTDLILIRVTPQAMRLGGRPESNNAKADRRMEVQLNAPTEAELRWASMHARDTGRPLNVHVISVPDAWPHSMESKTSFEYTNWEFFKTLRDAGERAGQLWLHRNGHELGKCTTYADDYREFGSEEPTATVKATSRRGGHKLVQG